MFYKVNYCQVNKESDLLVSRGTNKTYDKIPKICQNKQEKKTLIALVTQ
jgi:hypothetical protein